MVVDSELIRVLLVAAIPLSITIAVLLLVFNAGRRNGTVSAGRGRGTRSRFFDRYGIWVAWAVLTVGFVVQQQWWLLAACAVFFVWFGVLRPMDRRTNEPMREES